VAGPHKELQDRVGPHGNAVVSAGRWKLRRPGLSLADCFALAALESSAEVFLTTDPGLKEAAKSRAVLFGI